MELDRNIVITGY